MKKRSNSFLLLFIAMIVFMGCNNEMGSLQEETSRIDDSREVKLPESRSAGQLIYQFLHGENAYVKRIYDDYVYGRYVAMKGQGDGEYTPDHISTSEAMGYGMRLTAHEAQSMVVTNGSMARYKLSLKYFFNDLWRVQHAFLSNRNTGLHSWVIPTSMDPKDRSTAAADGDMDIAYALLQAHKIWGSPNSNPNGEIINYKAEALKIIEAIATHMTATAKINGVDITYITVGDWVSKGTFWAEYSRPSDWMIHHFRTFQRFLADEGLERSESYATYGKLIKGAEYVLDLNLFGTGLMPDFIHFNEKTNKIEPADPNSQFVIAMAEDTRSDAFSWNACRVPWRLAMDVVQERYASSTKSSRNTLKNIYYTTYRGVTSSLGTGSGYELDGTMYNPEFEIAFAAPIVLSIKGFTVTSYEMAKGIEGIINKERRILTSQFMGRDPNLGPNDEDYTYFGDAILCFSALILEGNSRALQSPY